MSLEWLGRHVWTPHSLFNTSETLRGADSKKWKGKVSRSHFHALRPPVTRHQTLQTQKETLINSHFLLNVLLINYVCFYPILSLFLSFSLSLCFWLSDCAEAAAMLVGVLRNLHSVLYCLRWGGGGGDRSSSGVSCWSVALNPEWHLCLDAGANIGFGPGHTLGRWVNGPLCQAHRDARPCAGQTCCLSTPGPHSRSCRLHGKRTHTLTHTHRRAVCVLYVPYCTTTRLTSCVNESRWNNTAQHSRWRIQPGPSSVEKTDKPRSWCNIILLLLLLWCRKIRLNSDVSAPGEEDIYSTTETDCWQAKQRSEAKAEPGGVFEKLKPGWKLTAATSQILMSFVCHAGRCGR